MASAAARAVATTDGCGKCKAAAEALAMATESITAKAIADAQLEASAVRAPPCHLHCSPPGNLSTLLVLRHRGNAFYLVMTQQSSVPVYHLSLIHI